MQGAIEEIVQEKIYMLMLFEAHYPIEVSFTYKTLAAIFFVKIDSVIQNTNTNCLNSQTIEVGYIRDFFKIRI
jgi:hypothetical protein